MNMRFQPNSLRAASVCLAAVILCVSATAQTNTSPSASRCDQLQQLLDQYKRVHDACLAAHSNETQVQETAEICSHPSCQAYHSYVYGSQGQALTAQIAACRHAEQYAQAAADEQKRTDAYQAAMYGNAAADANQITDQYNRQAAGIRPYAMSTDISQAIESLHDTANSLSAASNDGSAAANSDDAGVIVADNYAPPSAPIHPGSNSIADYSGEAARDVLDQGIENAVGRDAYDYYKDAQNLASGDTQKQLDGTFDLADKANDNYNSDPASKSMTHILLPKIHNIYSNAFNLLDSTGHAMSCITSSDSSCADASSSLEKQWNQFKGDPFGKPTNSWSDIFSQ